MQLLTTMRPNNGVRLTGNMALYLISIGAYRSKEGIDCVLLVEEFQKPVAQQALQRPGFRVSLIDNSPHETTIVCCAK